MQGAHRLGAPALELRTETWWISEWCVVIAAMTCSTMFSAKGAQTQTFGSGYLLVGRVSSAWGAKKFGMSLETQGNKLSGGISRDLGRDIPGAHKKFEKNILRSIFGWWRSLTLYDARRERHKLSFCIIFFVTASREICQEFHDMLWGIPFPPWLPPIEKHWDFPGTRQGPEVLFLGKEGFRVQIPPFPFALTQAGKGSFLWKTLFLDEGNGGFWTLTPSFPGNGDSGPVWGRSNPKRKIQEISFLCLGYVDVFLFKRDLWSKRFLALSNPAQHSHPQTYIKQQAGNSCFSNRACFRRGVLWGPEMPINIVYPRPQNWSRLKPPLLKHYCRCQGQKHSGRIIFVILYGGVSEKLLIRLNIWGASTRAMWSVRPKCSHRCVSLKESP